MNTFVTVLPWVGVIAALAILAWDVQVHIWGPRARSIDGGE